MNLENDRGNDDHNWYMMFQPLRRVGFARLATPCCWIEHSFHIPSRSAAKGSYHSEIQYLDHDQIQYSRVRAACHQLVGYGMKLRALNSDELVAAEEAHHQPSFHACHRNHDPILHGSLTVSMGYL